ncbi:hypothetical protein TrispH2_003450 [Trichoplax sp. H2]|uniref:Lipid-binding serum glycoprotein N-terminal domain-containing protein n=1 Tax=Trichoplax adhaerens TaxID=10228 RepID=B3RN43_TRIAD|nr:predicted protein [Trichoplax adhaerens]EDV27388.1 predicted protein [Trichoplax adhaerens]RDD43920.1 hypothetical protein TrispH2_003450 [Trichoplax sp. H2]|eukprot:XP_002109222.1 predicted protein [Trichoplax adhaerens]
MLPSLPSIAIILAITAATHAFPICKIPMEIQGTIQTLNVMQANKDAKPNLSAQSYKFTQDFKSKRIRLDGQVNGINTTIIEDFVEHKIYTIINNGKKCVTGNLTISFPDAKALKNATYLGMHTVGGSLAVYIYRFSLANISATVEVAKKTCLPVVEAAEIKFGKLVLHSAISFLDMKPKISNPNILKIPSICSQHATRTENRFSSKSSLSKHKILGIHHHPRTRVMSAAAALIL